MKSKPHKTLAAIDRELDGRQKKLDGQDTLEQRRELHKNARLS